jgi:hypothetical protein
MTKLENKDCRDRLGEPLARMIIPKPRGSSQ